MLSLTDLAESEFIELPQELEIPKSLITFSRTQSTKDEYKGLSEDEIDMKIDAAYMDYIKTFMEKLLEYFGVEHELIQNLKQNNQWSSGIANHIIGIATNPKLLFKFIKSTFDINVAEAKVQRDEDIKIQTSLESSFIQELDRRPIEYVYNCLSDLATKWNSALHYYPGTSLIQSSGAGKSRSVIALAEVHNVYVIYCSFMQGEGFPKESSIAQELKTGLNYTFERYYIACLQTISDCKAILDEKVIVKLCSGQTLVEKDHQEQFKAFQTYLSERKSGCKTFWDFVGEKMKKLESHEIFKTKKNEKGKTTSNDTEIRDFILEIVKKITGKTTSGLRVVFVFDEVRSLLNPKDPKNSPFVFMRRAARHFPEKYGLFVVLLDTVSRISNLSPSSGLDPSLRPNENGEESKMFSPIYALPTIDMDTCQIVNGITLLEECLKLSVLYKLGRPLWCASNNMSSNDLRLFAMRKLIGGKKLKDKTALNDHDCLAILRSRLPFKLWRSDISSELVATHMSWCTFISEDRHFVHSTVISEPILVDAATIWMSSAEYGFASFILKKYLEMAKNGAVDIGKFGEHVAALIFLLARDVAALEEKEELFTKVIKVDSFLKSLLGLDTFTLVNNKILHGARPITDGVISFSHFSYVNKTPTKEELLILLARGTAVLCKEMQKGIDLLIPVLMPVKNDNGKFILSSDNVTYILVQVKNYASSISDSKNLTISEKMKTAQVGLEATELDYLTIIMNVGEKIPYCQVMSTSNQKVLVLGGIDENLFPCLRHPNFLSNESFFKPMDDDFPNDLAASNDLLHSNGCESGEKWDTIQLPETNPSTNVLVKVLRQLLGRSSHPLNFFSTTSQEYTNTQSICIPFYLDTMKDKYLENPQSMIQRIKRASQDAKKKKLVGNTVLNKINAGQLSDTGCACLSACSNAVCQVATSCKANGQDSCTTGSLAIQCDSLVQYNNPSFVCSISSQQLSSAAHRLYLSNSNSLNTFDPTGHTPQLQQNSPSFDMAIAKNNYNITIKTSFEGTLINFYQLSIPTRIISDIVTNIYVVGISDDGFVKGVSSGISLRASASLSCRAGTFAQNGACMNCTGGYFSTGGTGACSQCSSNTYSKPGSASCTPCEDGKKSLPGSATCLVCQAGQYLKTDSCDACPAGSYSTLNSSTTCTLCPAGSFSGSGASSCTNCLPGTYALQGAGICTSCPVGTFSNISAASNCISCGRGYFSSIGSTSCSACQPGYYQSISKAESCSICPAGYFSGAASPNCTLCPNGTFSNGAAAQCTSSALSLSMTWHLTFFLIVFVGFTMFDY